MTNGAHAAGSSRTVRSAPFIAAALLALSVLLAMGTPSATAASCASTATYNGAAYCVGSITELTAGTYPAGTRLVLKSVRVMAAPSTYVRTLGTMTSSTPAPTCPSGSFCAATVSEGTATWATTQVDFRKVRSAPGVNWTVDT